MNHDSITNFRLVCGCGYMFKSRDVRGRAMVKRLHAKTCPIAAEAIKTGAHLVQTRNYKVGENLLYHNQVVGEKEAKAELMNYPKYQMPEGALY